MCTTREEKKIEAIERMKLLQLHENAIREFEEEGKLNLSENGGFLYWLNDEQQARVRAFEKEHDALVYHVIHSYTCGDEHLVYLYVSDYPDEWEYDRDDIKSGYPLAYVDNLSCEWCSEFGSIGIEPNIGGLRRTA